MVTPGPDRHHHRIAQILVTRCRIFPRPHRLFQPFFCDTHQFIPRLSNSVVWVLRVLPFFTWWQLIFFSMDQQEPVYFFWLFFVLVQQQYPSWLPFFSGAKCFESIVINRVVCDQLFPRWKNFFSRSYAFDVCLVACTNVVAEPLHKSGLLGKHPDFFYFCVVQHLKQNI